MEEKQKEDLKVIYDKIISMGLPFKRDFDDSEFNSYIAVGFQPFLPIEKMIGRVVQVRNESGAFGSNQVFLRCIDGSLQCHENQWFYKIPDSIANKIAVMFYKVELDEKNKTYSIGEKFKRKGFIIPSKIKAGQTTPMREVRKDIINLLNK